MGGQGSRGQHFFYAHLVLPVIAKIIGVRELVICPPREITQVDPPGIVGKVNAAGIRNPALLAPELEAVQVPVVPAHRYLEDVMQFRQRRVAPYQHALANLRADAQQMNLELVDRRQAVIVDSGRRRNGWEHDGDQQRGVHKLSQQVVEPDCPTLFDAL